MTGGEDEHQAALFRWAGLMQRQWPELRWLHHVPNGGLRSPRTAARLQRQGVRKGVPDICLPVPRRGYHGLYCELKRPGRHSVSPAQREWLQALAEHGYFAVVAVGWEEARAQIVGYLGGEAWQD